ncbi:MAG TPA: SUMF1/EgtB/PvdO family nonheme iron enzyme [Candidatus Brocadiia bacterium]|nr:SUMF1/EgtB/PvdO family nonheme iron enzyme [Candidatus Brocadiia bacterium]
MAENPVKFGPYELLEKIGEGLSGDSYKAVDTRTGRTVFLKRFAESFTENTRLRKYLFEQKGAHDELLEYPNLLSLSEVGKEDGAFYAALEYAEGPTLQQRMAEGPVSGEEAIEIIRQCCEALRASHMRNVPHRQLTPEHVFLTRDKTGRLLVKVAFFDVALATENSLVNVYGEMLGAPKYMAPEVIQGHPPTQSSDIFSLGVVAYELLCGRAPISSSHALGYLFANCNQTPQPLAKLRPEIPKDLVLIVEKMLARNQAERYQSCHALLDDLERCLQRIKTSHSPAVPPGSDSAFARSGPAHAAAHWTPSRVIGTSVAACMMLIAVLLMALALYFHVAKKSVAAGPRTATLPPSQPPINTSQTKPPAHPPEKVTPPPVEPAPTARDAKIEEEADSELKRADTAREARRFGKDVDYEVLVGLYRQIISKYDGTRAQNLAKERVAELMLEWSDKLAEGGKHEDACIHLDELIKIAPDSTWARTAQRRMPMYLAKSAEDLFRRGYYEKAVEAYAKAKKDYPTSVEATEADSRIPFIIYAQAEFFCQQEQHQNALEKLQILLKDYPGSEWEAKARTKTPEVHLGVARNKIKAGDFDEAIKVLDNILQQAPGTEAGAQARTMAAECLYQQWAKAKAARRSDEADAAMKKLMENYAGNMWAVRARRESRNITVQDRDVWDEVLAEERLNEAKQLYAAHIYDMSAGILDSIIAHTRENSETGIEADRMLPEVLYEWGCWRIGTGKPPQIVADDQFKRAMDEFPHSEAGKKAARAINCAKNIPPNMVYVPEGWFAMGSTPDQLVEAIRPFEEDILAADANRRSQIFEDNYLHVELPQQPSVVTGAFYIDQHETTNAEYAEFVKAAGHPAPWPGGNLPKDRANYPVVGITLKDAMEFAKWAGKRLPTEAEWEKAARGVEARPYPWGQLFDQKKCNHLAIEGVKGPMPVAQFPQGKSPYGCFDMIGNVEEWTTSYYDKYPGGPNDPNFGKKYRVVRGGSWTSGYLVPMATRTASRGFCEEDAKRPTLGFRCVKDVPPMDGEKQ